MSVALFFATTSAPLTTAPDLSVTVPWIVALAVAWAKALLLPRLNSKTASTNKYIALLILASPLMQPKAAVTLFPCEVERLLP